MQTNQSECGLSGLIEITGNAMAKDFISDADMIINFLNKIHFPSELKIIDNKLIQFRNNLTNFKNLNINKKIAEAFIDFRNILIDSGLFPEIIHYENDTNYNTDEYSESLNHCEVYLNAAFRALFALYNDLNIKFIKENGNLYNINILKMTLIAKYLIFLEEFEIIAKNIAKIIPKNIENN